MLIVKRSVAIIVILFSPLGTMSSFTSQLHNFLGAQLAGVGDKVRVSIRTAPNLPPSCEQPLLSTSNNPRLQGNMNVLACCDDDKRYLQVNVQAAGNYVVAAMPIAWGRKPEAGNVKLKRGRLDTLPSRTVLDTSQLAGVISLRDLPPDQLVQLIQFRQAWRVKAGQCVNVIASGGGLSANAKGRALNSAAVTQNARAYMISGQIISSIIDTDGDIFTNLQAVKSYPPLVDK